MSRYIGPHPMDCPTLNEAIAMAREFLLLDPTSEDIQGHANELDAILQSQGFESFVVRDVERCTHFKHDGCGPVFEEAKRQLLTEQLGPDDFARALEHSVNAARAWADAMALIDEPHRTLPSAYQTVWRTRYFISYANVQLDRDEEPRR